jgi:adenylylsulfate reductase subunit B
MQLEYRCGVKIDYKLCNACGKCYEVCPMDIFDFDNETRSLVVRYPEECWYCGACIIDCPVEGALKMDFPLACL